MGNVVATAIRMILASSPMPNQTMNSGTSDRKGSARKIWSGESSSSSPSRQKPVITPSTSPVATPTGQPGRRPVEGDADRGLKLPALPELPGGLGDLLRGGEHGRVERAGGRGDPPGADQHQRAWRPAA